MSVLITRVMPRRWASSVASVLLPTPLAKTLDEDVALQVAELLACDLVQVGEGEGRRPAAPQAPLHGGRHAVGLLGRQAGRHERLRHEAFAERRLVALVDQPHVTVVEHRQTSPTGPPPEPSAGRPRPAGAGCGARRSGGRRDPHTTPGACLVYT